MTTETEVAHADVARIIELDERKRALEEEIDRIKFERRTLEERVMEQWAEAGVQHVRQQGMTVYLRRDVWAGIHEEFKTAAPYAFMRADLGHMLSVNSQTLSAYVRELERKGEEAPEEIARLIRTTEQFSIRSRRAP